MKADSSHPLVSVVIPSFNGSRWIRETIDSVIAQTYPAIEIIVVDDASTDDSWSVINEYSLDVTAARNETNRGACYCRNRGVQLSSGDFVMFLDADDIITRETIGCIVDTLAVTGSDLGATDWKYLVEDGTEWRPAASGFPKEPPENNYLLGWLAGWFIPPCALLWRKDALERIGPWDESLTANQDGDLVVRALLAGISIARSECGTGLYRQHRGVGKSVSTTLSKSAVESRFTVLRRAEQHLDERGELHRYRMAIGRSYYELARASYAGGFSIAKESEKRAWDLAGGNAASGTLSHRVAARLVGLGRKERAAMLVRRRFQQLRAAFN